MLAVVEDEQRALLLEPLDEVHRWIAVGEARAERLRDRRRKKIAARKRRQFHEPDAVRIVGDEICRGVNRRTRLADPARPDQRHEAVPADQRFDLAHLGLAADERGGLDRQVVAVIAERWERRKLGGQTRTGELIDVFRMRQVFQTVPAEAVERRSIR